jgi:hypothetical protein
MMTQNGAEKTRKTAIFFLDACFLTTSNQKSKVPVDASSIEMTADDMA